MEVAIKKADVLIEALPYIKKFQGKIFVIKYGGSILGEEKVRKSILEDIAFLRYEKSWASKLTRCLTFSVITLVPTLIWILINLTDNSTPRSFVYHPIPLQKVFSGLQVISGWFFIKPNQSFILFFVLMLIFGVNYLAKNKRAHANTLRINLIDISSIFIPVYVGFLMVSISLFDAHTPLDYRTLSPVYIMLFISAFLIIHRASAVKMFPGVSKYIVWFAVIFFILSHTPDLTKAYTHIKNYGIGYASRFWSESAVLKYIDELPDEVPIFSNGPDSIQIHLNKKVEMIPRTIDPLTRIPNKNFQKEMDAMFQTITEENGIIVYFSRITWRWYLPRLSDFPKNLPAEMLYEGNDGTIFTINKVGVSTTEE